MVGALSTSHSAPLSGVSRSRPAVPARSISYRARVSRGCRTNARAQLGGDSAQPDLSRRAALAASVGAALVGCAVASSCRCRRTVGNHFLRALRQPLGLPNVCDAGHCSGPTLRAQRRRRSSSSRHRTSALSSRRGRGCSSRCAASSFPRCSHALFHRHCFVSIYGSWRSICAPSGICRYAPWCPFCKRLEADWDALPQMLQDSGASAFRLWCRSSPVQAARGLRRPAISVLWLPQG